MKSIAILGTGYVGLVTGTCFADLGNKVTCIDIIEEKIRMLCQGKSPIYEPGLEELILKNVKHGKLSFTTDADRAIKNSEIVFICLPTPSLPDGHCDTSYVLGAAETIGKAIDNYKIIVNKSTCPPGTARQLENEICKYTSQLFAVATNPEFLKEGSAVIDFMKPDRVVLGTENPSVEKILRQLYEAVTINGHPITVMKRESAEMVKYASNALLAVRISFINEIAESCEHCGADIKEVVDGMTSDPRIGPHFLHAGPGYGGSCFPKDTLALVACSKDMGVSSKITEAAYIVNTEHKLYAAKKIEISIAGLEGKKIGIWGLAFKANTDDIRESPALTIVPYLIERGAHIHANDPQAMENAKRFLSPTVAYHTNLYDVCKGSDVLVLLTEWNDYKDPDFALIKKLMKTPAIVDLRNLYYRKKTDLQSLGFQYTGMGT